MLLPNKKIFDNIKIRKNTLRYFFLFRFSLKNAPIAQLVEQQPFKLMVAGSSPAGRTKSKTQKIKETTKQYC